MTIDIKRGSEYLFKEGISTDEAGREQYLKTCDEVDKLVDMTHAGWGLIPVKDMHRDRIINTGLGAAAGTLIGALFCAWQLKRNKKSKTEKNTTVDQENEAE